MNRILIAGTRSGCGKTTLTCGILAALQNRGVPLLAFKCGPDYIDPMFHRAVQGIPSWNLDPYFLDPPGLVSHIASRSLPEGLAVIEGVMGYYDGIGMTAEASTYSVAMAVGAPVVLTLDVSGSGNSIAAVIEGFLRHKEPSGIQAVIFNNCSAGMYPYFRDIAKRIGVEPLGYMPRSGAWGIESRHLGLTVASEIPELKEKLTALGEQAEKSLDLDRLLDLASKAPKLLPAPPPKPAEVSPKTLRLAVARDEAFCFIYEENLEIFKALGCELLFFSPQRDASLPEDIAGLYLPGGYPELRAAELSQNDSLRQNIREMIDQGLPTIAECGGFLYLHETLDGFPMVGTINAPAFRTDRLQRFGYTRLVAERDNLLCKAGGSIRAHEFHYWESADPGNAFTGYKSSGAKYPCVHGNATLYAGFPHLYFPGNPDFAGSFTEKMREYQA